MRLVLLVVAALGCAGQKEQKHDEVKPVPAGAEAGMSDGVDIEWSVTKEPNALVLQYTVQNRTGKPIHVLDEIVAGSAKGDVVLPDRVIVRYVDGTVVFTAGQVRPKDAVAPGTGVGVARETMPVARSVAAGASVSGTKRVALPLAPWHPDVDARVMAPIPSTPVQAAFEVSWLPDNPPAGEPAWHQNPAAAGGMLKVPSDVWVMQSKQTARGPVVKL